MALTAKQQMFVKEYLIDLNATQAAIRAGYSKKTAEVIAHELLKKTLVAEAIQKHMDKRARKIEITAEDVLCSIRRIRDKTEADERWSEAIRANELLGKHLKLFTDKVETDHTGDINHQITVVFEE